MFTPTDRLADSSPEFIFTSYTTCSTHLFRRGMAWSTSLPSGTGQDDHRPGGRTTYQTDFTTNQLVGLLDAHSCSALTPARHSHLHGAHSCSVLTPARCSLLLGAHSCSPITPTRRSLLLGIHFTTDQLVGLLIAWASSLATLGTPRCSDSSCKRHQLR